MHWSIGCHKQIMFVPEGHNLVLVNPNGWLSCHNVFAIILCARRPGVVKHSSCYVVNESPPYSKHTLRFPATNLVDYSKQE